MKQGRLIPYFGAKAKREHLSALLPLIGRPKIYCEPFCGSCAVALRVQADNIIVNDLNRDLYNLSMCLSFPAMAKSLFARAEAALFCEEQSNAARAGLKHPIGELPDVKRAWAYLYYCWTAHNGFAGTDVPGFFNVRYSTSGGNGATRWRGVAESIQEWHERMRTWTITCRDGIKLVEDMPDHEDVTIFCDPPYDVDTRSDARYTHEFKVASLFDGQGDHERLHDALTAKSKARCVVTYCDTPMIRELYPGSEGWRVIENTMVKNLARGSGEALEIIITRNVPHGIRHQQEKAAGPRSKRSKEGSRPVADGHPRGDQRSAGEVETIPLRPVAAGDGAGPQHQRVDGPPVPQRADQLDERDRGGDDARAGARRPPRPPT